METITATKVSAVKTTDAENKMKQEKLRTRRYLLYGAAWVFGGFILLVISYIRSSGTRASVAIWTAFIIGIIQFTRGVARLKK